MTCFGEAGASALAPLGGRDRQGRLGSLGPGHLRGASLQKRREGVGRGGRAGGAPGGVGREHREEGAEHCRGEVGSPEIASNRMVTVAMGHEEFLVKGLGAGKCIQVRQNDSSTPDAGDTGKGPVRCEEALAEPWFGSAVDPVEAEGVDPQYEAWDQEIQTGNRPGSQEVP